MTLLASVRRRWRDLALLKTLGFTRRQLAATIAWQSSVAVAIGTVVGVPLGIALGRWLWNLFASEIHAVSDPSIPGLSIFLIAVGVLLLANAVAALPGACRIVDADRDGTASGMIVALDEISATIPRAGATSESFSPWLFWR